MAVISMKALLETGVHFGHRTRKWNPRMKPYIFTERNGIHIIDLQQTVAMIKDLEVVVRDLAASGGQVLFVGTKKQAQDAVREEAVRCGMFHVHNRWLGGTLTNFSTIRQSIDRLRKLEEMENDPKTRPAKVKVIARGKTFINEIRYRRGDTFTDVSWTQEDAVGKFKHNAERILTKDKIERATNVLLGLEKLDNVSQLMHEITL